MFLRNIKNSLIYERPFTRGLFKYVNRHSNGKYEDYLFTDSDVKSVIVYPLIPRQVQKVIRLPEMREHLQDICNLNHLVRISFVYIIYNEKNEIVKIINKILDKDKKPVKYDKAICIFSNNEHVESHIIDKTYDCLEMYLTNIVDNKHYNHWTYHDIKTDFSKYYYKCIGKNKRKSSFDEESKSSFDEERNVKMKLNLFTKGSYGPPLPPPPTLPLHPTFYGAIPPSSQPSIVNSFDSNLLSLNNGQQISNTFASNAFIKNIEMETKLTIKEREYNELYEQYQKLINKNKLYYQDNCKMNSEIRSLQKDNKFLNEKYKDKKFKYEKEIDEHESLKKLFKSKLTELKQNTSTIKD